MRTATTPPARIVFRGHFGSETETAALKFFGRQGIYLHIFPVNSTSLVLQAVLSQQAEYGILEVENSAHGTINNTYEEILRPQFLNLQVVGEVLVSQAYHLAVLVGTKLEDVQEIIATVSAFDLCSDYVSECLKRNPKMKFTVVNDSPTACLKLKNRHSTDCAVIVERRTAHYFQLQIVNEIPLSNDKDLISRFLMFSLQPVKLSPNDETKVMVAFSTPDQPKQLLRIVCAFAHRGFDILRIETRSLKPQDSLTRGPQFSGLMEIKGSLTDSLMKMALEDFEEFCIWSRILGCFRSGMREGTNSFPLRYKQLPNPLGVQDHSQNFRIGNFVEMFPQEILLQIFLYVGGLQIEHIGRASQVSRSWNNLLNDNIFWYRMCLQRGWLFSSNQLHDFRKNRVSSSWKSLFQNVYCTHRNWVNAHFVKTSIPLNQCLLMAINGSEVYCVLSGNIIQTFTMPHVHLSTQQFEMQISSIAANDDFLVIGSSDSNIYVFQNYLNLRKLIATLNGHFGKVRCLQIKGQIIVSGAVDGIRAWEIVKGKEDQNNNQEGEITEIKQISYIPAPQKPLTKIDFDENLIVTANDSLVMIWDMVNGLLLHSLQEPSSVWGVRMKGEEIVANCWNGHLVKYNPQNANLILRLETQSLNCFEFDEYFIVGATEKTICIWDTKTGQLMQRIETVAGGRSISFNQNFLFYATDDSLEVFDFSFHL